MLPLLVSKNVITSHVNALCTTEAFTKQRAAKLLLDHIIRHLKVGYTQSFYFLLDAIEEANSDAGTLAIVEDMRKFLSSSDHQGRCAQCY